MIFLNTPNNPTGQLIPIADLRAHRRGGAARRRADRRGVHRVRRHDVPAGAGALSRTCSSAGRSRRRTAWPACASASSSASRRRSIRCARVTLPFNINGVAMAATHGGARGHASSCRATPRRCAESRERLYAACRPARPRVLGERRQLRAGAGRRRRRRSSRRWRARKIHVRDRSKDPTTPGCIRITAGMLEHTDAAIEALGVGMVRGQARADAMKPRAAAFDRRTTETQIRGRLVDRRPGPLRRPHRHPVLRSHARAVHPARRLRPDAARDRRPRRRSAPHRRGRRHRARRGGAEGARRPQGHQPRRLLRDADGRDAGGRGDRSRAAGRMRSST